MANRDILSLNVDIFPCGKYTWNSILRIRSDSGQKRLGKMHKSPNSWVYKSNKCVLFLLTQTK